MPSSRNPALARIAAACLVLLAAACLAWELAIAPLRPGGSLLALKALPAVVPVAGVLQERRYTFQWSCMLVLAYAAEGLVRAVTDTGPSRAMAMAEVVLSAGFFVVAVAYLRVTRGAPA